MSKPRADLRQAMQASAKTAGVREVRPEPAEQAVAPDTKAAAYHRPSRDGKTNVTGYYPTPVKKQLRHLAAEKDTTIQDLLAEALNDLFAKHGKPEIVPLGQQ